MEWTKKGKDVRSIQLDINFWTFKQGGTKAFDEFANLVIHFNEYKYQIFQENNGKERLYHQLLSNEEIETIATKFAGHLMTQIERRAEELK